MSRKLLRSIVLAAAAAMSLPAAGLAGTIDPNAAIPAGPGVRIGKLPNGLTYYIRQNKLPARRLELRLVVKAGSILEDEDQRGLAHFVEHMAFNGSTHFKRHEIVSYLQSLGMRFGADLNAYTSFDETWYLLPVPTARQEDIDKGFTILEDWAHGIAFNEADIDRERSVILEEARTHKGAGERVNRALSPKLYNGSRYAERIAIGTDESIRGFRPEALRRFYRDWYRPDLMAVVAVGDAEPEELERQIKAHFGALQNPPDARPRQWEAIRPRERTEGLVVTDPELQVNTVALYYPVRPADPPGTYGSYRNKLLENLFEAMLAQRLAELSQQANPPFLGAGSSLAQMTPRYRAYVARATLGPRGHRAGAGGADRRAAARAPVWLFRGRAGPRPQEPPARLRAQLQRAPCARVRQLRRRIHAQLPGRRSAARGRGRIPAGAGAAACDHAGAGECVRARRDPCGRRQAGDLGGRQCGRGADSGAAAGRGGRRRTGPGDGPRR
jgi:zinc protease